MQSDNKALTYSFPNIEPVHCSMSHSNCCFLICIQISQEAGQVVWYSHLLKNFPQFFVIHTAKGFGVVNKADVFLELFCFFYDPTDVGNLIHLIKMWGNSIKWLLVLDTLPPSHSTESIPTISIYNNSCFSWLVIGERMWQWKTLLQCFDNKHLCLI